MIATGVKYFCDVKVGNLDSYFDTFWFSDKWVKTWPMKERRGLCTSDGNNSSGSENDYVLHSQRKLTKEGDQGRIKAAPNMNTSTRVCLLITCDEPEADDIVRHSKFKLPLNNIVELERSITCIFGKEGNFNKTVSNTMKHLIGPDLSKFYTFGGIESEGETVVCKFIDLDVYQCIEIIVFVDT
ncbi:hypothetical protein DAPPUDRAFT_269019 [Daphnia pulex]|uniref:Uncharacterized protein n=1 Tax=Daphnia pulex TaxID=6669 RepID=E9HYP3_DAPPU|nr:hypothetical protein DAPPUDRAFT_269019 [Daphnia pulex]|eukprot:EFX63137.1 hypothetical protein DAPPUDRAFT_269019 [Daphnia pulex]